MYEPQVGRIRAPTGVAVVVMSLLALNACASMRRLNTPADYIESQHPDVVRITRADGTRLLMSGARVLHGTVAGFVQPAGDSIAEFQAVPLDAIAFVETKQWSTRRTLFLVGGVGVALGVGYLLIAGNRGVEVPPNFANCSTPDLDECPGFK